MFYNSLSEYYGRAPGRKGPIESWQYVRSKILTKVMAEKNKINGIDLQAMERMYQSAFYGNNKTYVNYIANAASKVVDSQFEVLFNKGIDLIADTPVTGNKIAQRNYKWVNEYLDRTRVQVKTVTRDLNTILSDMNLLQQNIVKNYNATQFVQIQTKIVNLTQKINNFLSTLNNGNFSANSYLNLQNDQKVKNDIINILNEAKVLSLYFGNSDFTNSQNGEFFENAFEAVSKHLDLMVEDTSDAAVINLINSIKRTTNTATNQVKMSQSNGNSVINITDETLTYFTESTKSGRKGAIDLGWSMENGRKRLIFKINQTHYDFNTTGQQKADVVLKIEDKQGNLNDIGISLKNWSNGFDGKTKFETLILHSVFQAAGGMAATKNFLYMFQDNVLANGDHFTNTTGIEAVNSAIDMAKICGAVTALMGIGQKSSSRAQVLIFNDKGRREIKVINIPKLLIDFADGYIPLVLNNSNELYRIQRKMTHLGLYLSRQSERKSEYFYGLATALLSNIKLKYSLV